MKAAFLPEIAVTFKLGKASKTLPRIPIAVADELPPGADVPPVARTVTDAFACVQYKLPATPSACATPVELAAAFILGKQVARLADNRLHEVIGEALGLKSKQKMLDYFLRERSFQDSSARLEEASHLLETFAAGWRG